MLLVHATVGVDGVDRGLDTVSVPRAAAVEVCVVVQRRLCYKLLSAPCVEK